MLIKDPKERRRVAEIKYLRALFWLLGWKYTSREILVSLLSPRGAARLRKFGLIESKKQYFASVVELSSFGWDYTSELFMSNYLLKDLPDEYIDLIEKLTRRNKKTVNWVKLKHDLAVQKTLLDLLRGKTRPYILTRYKDFESDDYGHIWESDEIIEEWEEADYETPGTYLSEYTALRLGLQPAPDAIYISFNEKAREASIWGIEYESGQNKNIKRLTTKISAVVNNLILEKRLINGIAIYGSKRTYQKAFDRIRNNDHSLLFKSPLIPEQERELYKKYYSLDIIELYDNTVRGYEFYQPQPKSELRDFVITLSSVFWPHDPFGFDRELLGKLFTHSK